MYIVFNPLPCGKISNAALIGTSAKYVVIFQGYVVGSQGKMLKYSTPLLVKLLVHLESLLQTAELLCTHQQLLIMKTLTVAHT